MRSFLLLFLLYVLSNSPNSLAGQDARAEKILQDSRRVAYLTRDFSANLTYEIRSPSNRPIFKTGTFRYLLYRNQYRFVVTFNDQWIISDGNILWIYFPRTNELASFATEDWAHDNILTVIRQLYLEASTIRYGGIEMISGSPHYKLYFTMRNRSLSYYKAIMWVDQKNLYVKKVLLLDRQRTQRIYQFSNIRVNSGINSNIFQFNPEDYPGIKERHD